MPLLSRARTQFVLAMLAAFGIGFLEMVVPLVVLGGSAIAYIGALVYSVHQYRQDDVTTDADLLVAFLAAYGIAIAALDTFIQQLGLFVPLAVLFLALHNKLVPKYEP